ncbi:ion transporter, partial [bacterium]|nr:ion transporter [bacterium]
MKNQIKKILNNTIFEKFIILLIIFNLVIFTLQTEASINKQFYAFFNRFEIFCVVVFSVEYLMRVFTLKRLKDIFNFYMVVDFLAIAPFYLSFLSVNTTILRGLRLFRIFRVVKLTRYDDAITNITNAFRKRKYELVITGWICIFAIFISSTLIYYAENQTGNVMFSSIPRSSWWSIVTITTVGYGDATPATALGKMVASLTAILGVGLHGLLIGIISTAFMDAINVKVKEK